MANRKSINEACDVLYRAASDYITELGGVAVMCVGTQMMTWPGDNPRNFSLVVKMVGRKPELGEAKKPRSKKAKR